MKRQIQKLLKVKEIFERQRKRELEVVRALRRQKESEIKELERQIENQGFSFETADAFSLQLFAGFVSSLFDRKRKLEKELEKIKHEEEEKLRAYTEARKEKEIARRLLERHLEREVKENLKREEKFYDELILLRRKGR